MILIAFMIDGGSSVLEYSTLETLPNTPLSPPLVVVVSNCWLVLFMEPEMLLLLTSEVCPSALDCPTPLWELFFFDLLPSPVSDMFDPLLPTAWD
jgi:hypothetical protein